MNCAWATKCRTYFSLLLACSAAIAFARPAHASADKAATCVASLSGIDTQAVKLAERLARAAEITDLNHKAQLIRQITVEIQVLQKTFGPSVWQQVGNLASARQGDFARGLSDNEDLRAASLDNESEALVRWRKLETLAQKTYGFNMLYAPKTNRLILSDVNYIQIRDLSVPKGSGLTTRSGIMLEGFELKTPNQIMLSEDESALLTSNRMPLIKPSLAVGVDLNTHQSIYLDSIQPGVKDLAYGSFPDRSVIFLSDQQLYLQDPGGSAKFVADFPTYNRNPQIDVTPDGLYALIKTNREILGIYDRRNAKLLTIPNKFSFTNQTSQQESFLQDIAYIPSEKKLIAKHWNTTRMHLGRLQSLVLYDLEKETFAAIKDLSQFRQLTPLLSGDSSTLIFQQGANPLFSGRMSYWQRFDRWLNGLKPSDGKYAKVFLIDSKTLKPVPLPESWQTGHVRFVEEQAGGSLLLFEIAEQDSMSQYYIFDIRTGKATYLEFLSERYKDKPSYLVYSAIRPVISSDGHSIIFHDSNTKELLRLDR